jgi:predicted RNA-binding protein Jag
MVERIVSEVETTGDSVVLPYLSPLERRFVHMFLTDNEKVTSESNGEGRDRRVTIKLKSIV